MEFKKNWNKRTPLFWRRIGNTAIYSLPLLTTTIMASPLSIGVRGWLSFVLTIILVGAKAVTKFFVEDENVS